MNNGGDGAAVQGNIGVTQAFPPPLLRLQGVRKAFGAVQALRGAALEVAEGEVHALVGENGAGKSTLMSILGGSFPPDAGELEFRQRGYRPRSPRAARDAGIALIHQELALAPHLDVEENICLGREKSMLGIVRRQTGKVRETLQWLGYGRLDPRAKVGNLGVSERQIVEIARALFLDAKLILMDEPTSSLPAAETEKLFEVIFKLKAKGVSIVYISHFLEEVRRVADRITVLRDGETAAAGLPAETPMEEILRHMVGRPVAEVFPQGRREFGTAVLKIKNLIVRPEAEPVNLELRRGQILGIAGLVGSGRSSLLRGLYGLRTALAGEIELEGRKIAAPSLNPTQAHAFGLGFLSEDRKEEGLALSLPIAANATLADLNKFFRRKAPGLLELGREAREVEALCEELHVRYRNVGQTVGGLSGGNQQKVALARLLLGNACAWLLDEPTRGVDVGAKAEIYRLISDWAARGKAVIWAGSYLPELFGVCDSLAVMHKGGLSPVRPIGEWTEASVMAWATTGREGGK